MTQKTKILQKAIERAVKNGYKTDWYRDGVWTVDETYGDVYEHYVESPTIIFSHEFAKAFWGEKDMWYETECTCGGVGIHMSDDTHSEDCARPKAPRGYRFHLQQMVIEKEPLKYLEQFLGEND